MRILGLSLTSGTHEKRLPKDAGAVFEQALEGEQRERIETIKRDLLAYGAKTSAMTGSGSVVFGLFSDEAACRRACEALQGECVKTFCAKFV